MASSKYTLLLVILSALLACSYARGPWNGPQGGHKGKGGKGGNCPFPKPTFLKDLNRTEVEKFKEIQWNRNLTRNEINTELQNWAASQTGEVQSAFNTWREQIVSTIANLTVQADAAVANLSSDAQTLYKQLKPIVKNNDITENEKCTEVKTILANTTTKVVRELLKAVPMATGPCGRRGRGGHGRKSQSRGGKRGPNSSEEDGFGRRGPGGEFNGASNNLNDASFDF